jgi:hypothetical protein
MKLFKKYIWLGLLSIVAFLIVPWLLFPVCEGCCVCSISAHVNDRFLIEMFFAGLWAFFYSMAFIEEWAHGAQTS